MFLLLLLLLNRESLRESFDQGKGWEEWKTYERNRQTKTDNSLTERYIGRQTGRQRPMDLLTEKQADRQIKTDGLIDREEGRQTKTGGLIDREADR